MARKTTEFTLREKDLSAALEITPERLDEIIEFFDSNPNDEWELRENDHFVYLDKKWKERLFSYHGAFAIAKYMDTIEKKSLWSLIVEFVTKHKEKIRNAFVCQKVVENSSSLVKRNGFHFLSKKDVINILCTSPARLNKAFYDLQKKDLMAIEADFDDIDGVRYYSLAGFYRLCSELSAETTGLKDKDRREWCAAVEIVGKKTFKALIDAEAAKEQRIESAKKSAKRRDNDCCQITGTKPSRHNKFNLAVHHIFSKECYPHLATSSENLITMREEIHKEFHSWNGGYQKACTIDELIQFVNALYSDEEKYPDRQKLSVRLNQIKQSIKP